MGKSGRWFKFNEAGNWLQQNYKGILQSHKINLDKKPRAHFKPDLPGPKIQVLHLTLRHDQYWVPQLEQFDLGEGLPSLCTVFSISPVMSANS